jgi:hypothetical protein
LSLKTLAYGRSSSKYEYLSPTELRALQEKRLRAIVEDAYQHTRFWHQWLDKSNLKPGDIHGLDDLSKLPTLHKKRLDFRAARRQNGSRTFRVRKNFHDGLNWWATADLLFERLCFLGVPVDVQIPVFAFHEFEYVLQASLDKVQSRTEGRTDINRSTLHSEKKEDSGSDLRSNKSTS